MRIDPAAAAAVASSVIRSAFPATASTDLAISSIDVNTSSIEPARFSAAAPTCSIEVAILVIDADVCSAATVRSSELLAKRCVDRDISSIVLAISVIDVARPSVSPLTVLMDAAI